MRILHVIHSVDPVGGGPIEGVTQLAARAHEAGHDVEIASLDHPNSSFGVPTQTKVHKLGPSFSKYGFARQLGPWVKRNAPRFDIVIVNGIWQYHSFAIWGALRRSQTPYVVFTHGMLDPWFKRRYPLKHLKKWLYWPWAEYRVLRDAAAVFFTCTEEKILARQSFWLYRANEIVVDYGTAGPPDNEHEQRSAVTRAFPGLQGKRVALFLGRIHPKKACDVVIKAFSHEFGSDPGWHLVMAGPDQSDWRPELESIAEKLGVANRITWAGVVAGPIKWGLIRTAEIFLLPSHQENFGIAVAEALACGVPVLISDKVNIWREVKREGAGFVSSDSEAGLSETMRRWVSLSPEQQLVMREKARACFEQHFAIRKASQTLIANLQTVANSYRQPVR